MRLSIRALAGALAIALVVAVLVFKVTSKPASNSSAETTVTVLVAAKAIPVGLSLAEVRDQGYAREETMSNTQVPPDALTAITPDQELLGAIAPLDEGDVLASSNFSAAQVNSGPLNIPSGMMAVSIDLSDPAHVGSFIRPGSEIAVFGTVLTAGANNEQAHETKVLFPRVKVLAVGDITTKEAADAAMGGGSMLVTVVVTPRQAQKLVHAVQTTTLYLGLLNGQTEVPPTGAVTDKNLFDEVK